MLRRRNNAVRLFRFTRKLRGNETGVTFIETLVALALLGLIAVAFVSGVATVSKAVFIADERTTAESLARSEMEYVKSQGYATSYTPAEYDGYTVEIDAVPLDGRDGIQRIKVTVSRGGEEVLAVVGYKVDR